MAQPMKRLTVDVPANLYHRLSAVCAHRELKMADVVRDMLERELSRDHGAPVGSKGMPKHGAPVVSSTAPDLPLVSGGTPNQGTPIESGQRENGHHEPIIGLGDFR
jgi:hypothetical protein